MTPAAEKLIQSAREGVRLSSKDRRHCIIYLQVTDPDMTNSAMGELFGVSERQIRNDTRHIRQEVAKNIKEDDIGLVIADVALNFERQIRDIEKSKRKATIGSRTYLEHCRSIFNMELEKIKSLQALGFYPHNLGQMTTVSFEYKAIVSKDGSVDTRESSKADGTPRTIEAEFEDVKQIEASKL